MKKILIGILCIFIVSLIYINVNSTMDFQELYDKNMITISNNSKDIKRYSLDDIEGMDCEEFIATFQKKVGPPVDNNYEGIEISKLLENSGLDITQINSISVTSLDNFTVELSPEEVMLEDNIFLVYKVNEKYLKVTEGEKKSGSFMLVIKNDSVSTRWARDLVNINVHLK